MKVILSESQYRQIINESFKDEVNDYVANIKDFAKSVILKAQDDIGINLKMLLIWGAGVGGVMAPLNEFIANGNFKITDMEVSLILCSVCAILFGESKSTIKELISIIKERGLEDEFSQVMDKGQKLKSVFISFIKSLNMTLSTVTNVMSYAFIIPVLPLIYDLAKEGINNDVVKEIGIRFLSFGLATVSGIVVRELVIKLLNRFKN